VTRKVYYTLGKYGIDTDRRIVLLHMDNISEAMDACIEKLEGVILFGKDRPIETLDQAMKRELFSTCVLTLGEAWSQPTSDTDTMGSQILAGAPLVLCFAHDAAALPVVTDRRVEKIIALKWTPAGGKEVVYTTLQHLFWSDNPNNSAEDPLISECGEEHDIQQEQGPTQAENSSVLLDWDGHQNCKTILDEKVKLEQKLNEAEGKVLAAETLALEANEKCKSGSA